jgi:hypothetical protein
MVSETVTISSYWHVSADIAQHKLQTDLRELKEWTESVIVVLPVASTTKSRMPKDEDVMQSVEPFIRCLLLLPYRLLLTAFFVLNILGWICSIFNTFHTFPNTFSYFYNIAESSIQARRNVTIIHHEYLSVAHLNTITKAKNTESQITAWLVHTQFENMCKNGRGLHLCIKDSRSAGRNLDTEPCEYEAGIPTIRQQIESSNLTGLRTNETCHLICNSLPL